MRENSRSHYVVLGAGAVGGTMGALLAAAGQRVTLVGRPALAEAVRRQGGIRLISSGSERLIGLEAVSEPADVRQVGPAILFITTKANDLEGALASARRVFPRSTLSVTWQNGLHAEEIAAESFPNLLGGVVRATSTMLTPGEVRIRAPGLLIVGRTPPPPPDRLDPEREHVVRDLVRAGFDAVSSPDIRADKGLKLLLNLISGASPLVHRGSRPCLNLTRLERGVLIEGARILRAAGVPAYAASGRGDDVRTMLANLEDRPVRPPTRDGVHNSTWQNLHIPGRRLENGFMNGEIVDLARRLFREAPWNERLLSLLAEVHDRKLGPEALSDDELGARLGDLTDPAPWTDADEAPIPV